MVSTRVSWADEGWGERRMDRASRRVHALAYAAALLPFLALVTWFWQSGPGLTVGDYAHYLLHGRALAEGRPYADTGYIFTNLNAFIGPEVQPPGLPVLLAVLIKVFGGYNETAVRLVMLGSAIPFLVISGVYFGRRTALGAGVVIVLFAGVAPGIAHWSLLTMSDLGFCSLVWALIAVLDREGEFTWSRVAAVLALGSAVMAYRVVGLAVVPTLVLFGLLNYRALGVRPLLPAAVWGAGAGALVVAMGLMGGITRQLAPDLLLDPGIVVPRIRGYLLAVIQASLYPTGVDRLDDLYHVVVLLLMAAGLTLWIRTAWRSAAFLFFGTYLATLMLVTAHTGRYLWVVFPVLINALFVGADALMARIRPALSIARRQGLIVAIALAVALMATYRTTLEPRPGSILDDPNVLELLDFLSMEASRSEVRTMFFKPRVLTWMTRVPAMGMVDAFVRETESVAVHPRERILGELETKGITHVVVGALGQEPMSVEALTTIIARNECRFISVYANPEFEVFRMGPPCEP